MSAQIMPIKTTLGHYVFLKGVHHGHDHTFKTDYVFKTIGNSAEKQEKYQNVQCQNLNTGHNTVL